MEPDQNLYQVSIFSKNYINKIIFVVSYDSEEAMKRAMTSNKVKDDSEIQRVEVDLIAKDSRSSEPNMIEEVCFLAN